MIKDIIEQNAQATPNADELAILHRYFPSCFTNEGKFDLDLFEARIKDSVDTTKEGYALNYLGKDYARLIASMDTTTVIVPDEEHNSKPENKNSENIYISGDNLDALSHLLKSYAGRIKCIYIDPPYNTGSDGFLYNDNFNFSKDDLVSKLSISEENANRLLEFSRRGASSHSAWLTFMAPRLQIARGLLNEDGVIFISIDDNEMVNLKLLCDSIFGEENFVGNLIWKSRQNKDNRNVSGLSVDHEYVLCYASDASTRVLIGAERKTEQYSNPDKDPRGPWTSGNMVGLLGEDLRPNCHYDLINPATGINYGKPQMGWRYDQKTMSKLITEGRILWPDLPSGRPRRKVFLNELSNELPNFTSIIGKDVYTRNGTKEVVDLFGFKAFDFPKPTKLLSELIGQIVQKNENAIVLDFFSGCASTADAIMQMNSADGGNRKYIMVQIPEKCNPNSEAAHHGYSTIDEVGQARIRKAGVAIHNSSPLFASDLGFRHYTLKDIPQNTLDQMDSFSPDAIVDELNLKDRFGLNTILTTWLIRDGYGFNAQVEAITLDSYTVYSCGQHMYFIDEGLSEQDVIALVDLFNRTPSSVPSTLVLFGYSFLYHNLELVKKNLRSIKIGEDTRKLNIDVRY